MSFAVRLTLALVLVAVFATGLWAYELRSATTARMEESFALRVDAASSEAALELASESKRVDDATTALCRDGFVDRALAELDAKDALALDGDGADDASSGAKRVTHLGLAQKAASRGLDHLWLVRGDGAFVTPPQLSATPSDAALGKRVGASAHGGPELRRDGPGGEPAVIAWCSKASHGVALAAVGSRRIEPVLERVGAAHGVALALFDPSSPPAPSHDAVMRAKAVDGVAGLSVSATASREPLTKAMSSLDREILEDGGVAIVAALVLAYFLARSFTRPIRELVHETREVLTGEPRPVRQRGSREIRELADTFNHTIEELTRIKKRLAATERIAARREIARQVAHEIKNPLAPIRAAVETLRRLRGRNDEAFDDYFDEATRTVLDEVHRIANIVSQFTKFSRLPPPDLAPVNIVSVAKRVVALHAADPDAVRTGAAENPAEAGRVDLTAEDVPEIRADRDQMVQVLTNLVANGLDAAAAVRDDPRVNITIGRVGEGKVRIVVRDNGPGVAEEMREKLFEPYATSKKHGTGLGLAICQRIVFEHGGEITYRPATKGGAVFEIVLPIAGPTLLEKSMEISSNPTSRFES